MPRPRRSDPSSLCQCSLSTLGFLAPSREPWGSQRMPSLGFGLPKCPFPVACLAQATLPCPGVLQSQGQVKRQNRLVQGHRDDCYYQFPSLSGCAIGWGIIAFVMRRRGAWHIVNFPILEMHLGTQFHHPTPPRPSPTHLPPQKKSILVFLSHELHIL